MSSNHEDDKLNNDLIFSNKTTTSYYQEDQEATIQKIQTVLKDYEIYSKKNQEMQMKRENISNELKSTLSLVNEDPKKKLKALMESLDSWINSTKNEMEITKNALQTFEDNTHSDMIKKKNFIEKFHIYRESGLSTLFKSDKNMKSLYYLVLTLFSWYFLYSLTNDYHKTGSIIDFEFWKRSFCGYKEFISFWFIMLLYMLIIIPYVKFIESDSKKIKRVRFIYFIIYLIFQLIIYIVAFWFIFSRKLSVACSLATGAEITRFSLKIHGYFREKMLYGLKDFHIEYASFTFRPSNHGHSKNNLISNNSNKNNISQMKKDTNVSTNENNKKDSSCYGNNSGECNNTKEQAVLVDIKIFDFKTEFKKFIYYLFCPSLIYRDEYPRLTYHRPHYILAHIFNFSCCIAFYYIFMRHICQPYFSYSKIQDYYSLSYFLFDTFRFAIPGVCFLVVGFFLILHTWMNLWSEIILHGDRRFYEDWWNCTNFEQYYRKWNMVVHEWLYYYIYNDVLRLSKGKLNRLHAKLIVFGLSVIIHEIIVTQALGFFFPILALFFGGPGIIFTYIKTEHRLFNMVFWCKLFLGKGLILLFYLREFSMRSFFEENIKFVSPYHEFIPRTILMFMNPYKDMILNHFSPN